MRDAQLDWPPPRLTLQEFLALTEDNERRWQLVEGEVVVHKPSDLHERAVLQIGAAMLAWETAAPGRGHVTLAVDTTAGPRSWLAPDVQWWGADRERNDPSQRPQPLGDVVVEVQSPSTAGIDRGRKRRLYEQLGLPELWLVDPETRTAVVLTRSSPEAGGFDVTRALGPDDVLTSAQLPGFALELARAFA